MEVGQRSGGNVPLTAMLSQKEAGMKSGGERYWEKEGGDSGGGVGRSLEKAVIEGGDAEEGSHREGVCWAALGLRRRRRKFPDSRSKE